MDAANDVDFQDVAVTDLALQEFTPDPVRSMPLVVAVRRAIGAVREETRALRANPTADLKIFEYGKSQALLDLSRARTLVPPAFYSEELREDIAEFKEVLDENVGLLQLHMNAVTEVVGMMSRTMIDYESDGTYQAPFPERAR
ncbi:hypothetical protein B0E33_25935 [Roseibium algicola]|jgi:hypothetical protein|uniref:Uncharacterized protein n=1 Tax=Roseibium algicola TaxID=2857014 RepID=A0ABN4X4C1_9HYPH|nr:MULTISPECIES: hypothetical protein [Stappiaceae]MCR9282977.1 hypothetical protein [Paracoccaceae bacterium]MEC9418859.1 hypothetical protein [Pseudomonadota bacterium]AQQ06595.1 hypothetical protein B0E33_25935 [Roseibium aggregatum]ERP97934.1 hypothetical protein Q669_22290 [Labrenzia sp. C1B10]ERS01726.1 hypothetical protein Q675_06405 [Labrenzia sp. C1B70]